MGGSFFGGHDLGISGLFDQADRVVDLSCRSRGRWVQGLGCRDVLCELRGVYEIAPLILFGGRFHLHPLKATPFS